MKVFVWKAHGDISVYTITEKLKEDILTCLSHEGFEINDERDYSWNKVQEMIYAAQGSDSDMFESGTGIVSVEGE